MEHIEQVELITVLETVTVVLQGVVTVAFISVPSLFYIAGEELRAEDEKPEVVEDRITKILTASDVFLIFLLIAQIFVVFQLKAGFKEKNDKKLRPWLGFNLILYLFALGATIIGIIFLTSSWGLHVFNFLFLLYRAWTLIQVLLFYKELNAREPLNSKPKEHVETEIE